MNKRNVHTTITIGPLKLAVWFRSQVDTDDPDERNLFCGSECTTGETPDIFRACVSVGAAVETAFPGERYTHTTEVLIYDDP